MVRALQMVAAQARGVQKVDLVEDHQATERRRERPTPTTRSLRAKSKTLDKLVRRDRRDLAGMDLKLAVGRKQEVQTERAVVLRRVLQVDLKAELQKVRVEVQVVLEAILPGAGILVVDLKARLQEVPAVIPVALEADPVVVLQVVPAMIPVGDLQVDLQEAQATIPAVLEVVLRGDRKAVPQEIPVEVPIALEEVPQEIQAEIPVVLEEVLPVDPRADPQAIQAVIPIVQAALLPADLKADPQAVLVAILQTLAQVVLSQVATLPMLPQLVHLQEDLPPATPQKNPKLPRLLVPPTPPTPPTLQILPIPQIHPTAVLQEVRKANRLVVRT